MGDFLRRVRASHMLAAQCIVMCIAGRIGLPGRLFDRSWVPYRSDWPPEWAPTYLASGPLWKLIDTARPNKSVEHPTRASGDPSRDAHVFFVVFCFLLLSTSGVGTLCGRLE